MPCVLDYIYYITIITYAGKGESRYRRLHLKYVARQERENLTSSEVVREEGCCRRKNQILKNPHHNIDGQPGMTPTQQGVGGGHDDIIANDIVEEEGHGEVSISHK